MKSKEMCVMKKMKVLLMSGMLAAGICMLAACGTGNQDNNNVLLVVLSLLFQVGKQ